jgi:hypothetical protein
MQGSMVGGVTIRNLDLHLVKVSQWPGGYRDFRPGGLGVVNGAVPAVLVQYVDTLVLSGVKITMPKDPRLSWSTMVKMHTHSVKTAWMDGIQVGGQAGVNGSAMYCSGLACVRAPTQLVFAWPAFATESVTFRSA